MRIQHNIMAMNAYRNYNTNTSALSKNLEKLSSGYKINRAGDDAAGLAISEKMRAQITGLNAAQKNVKDGISLVKTAEGAMQEIQDMLNRMDYLATQSANGTYDNDVDRANLQKEVNALRDEIDRIADSANFNGIKLMDGTQKTKGADVSTVAVDVSTVTSNVGKEQSGGAITNLNAQFTPQTNDHVGLHPGSAAVGVQDPKFSIDISGVTITGVTNGTAFTVTINVAGKAITASVTPSAASVGGGAIAHAFDAVTVDIGGVEFKLAADTSGTITFNLTTAGFNGTSTDATNVNALIKGSPVEVSTGATGAQVSGNWVHGVQNITEAVAADAGGLAGVSFKLDDKVVKDNYKLTIGGTTFVFKLNKDTTTSGGTEIDLTNVAAADRYKVAAQKIALAVNTITDSRTGNNATKFTISSTDSSTGAIIHLDQKKGSGTDASKDTVYDADMLKGLFALTAPTNAEKKASITLSTSLDTGVKEGDVVAFNNKTYTIGTAPADAKNPDSYISAASFNALVNDSALNSLKSAAEEVLAASATYSGQFEVTLANGEVKIAAKAGDDNHDDAAIREITAAIDAKVADISMSKIKKEDIGKGGLTLQIGDTSDPFNQLAVKIGDMHVSAMGVMEELAGGEKAAKAGQSIAEIDISNPEGASKAIEVIKNAINYVSSVRGDLGAVQNRLEHTANNLSVMAENIQDAESTIRDTDVAEEMMAYTKNNILIQSAQAMLAQANAVPQGVLQLLG